MAGGHCSRQPELVPTQLLLLLELLLASVDATPQHLLLGFSLSDWRRTCASLGSSALLLVPQARRRATRSNGSPTASPEAISASGSGMPTNAGTLAASTTSDSSAPPPTLGALGRRPDSILAFAASILFFPSSGLHELAFDSKPALSIVGPAPCLKQLRLTSRTQRGPTVLLDVTLRHIKIPWNHFFSWWSAQRPDNHWQVNSNLASLTRLESPRNTLGVHSNSRT